MTESLSRVPVWQMRVAAKAWRQHDQEINRRSRLWQVDMSIHDKVDDLIGEVERLRFATLDTRDRPINDAPEERAMMTDERKEWVYPAAENEFDRWIDNMQQEARGSLKAAYRRGQEDMRERAALLSKAEKLTGIPPVDWPIDKIEACEATVRATAKSIADAIRALPINDAPEDGE
jgi:hypothetical protein